MSWYSLLIVVLMALGLFGLFIKKNWPRDENGELMNPDEVSEFLDKFPNTSTTKSMMMGVIAIFATIAMFAVAITRRKEYNPDTSFDSDFHDSHH